MPQSKIVPKFLSGYFLHLAIISVIVLYFLNYLFDLSNELISVMLFLIMVFTSVLVIRYKQVLLFTLALLIPLSFPFSLTETAKIGFPTEIICLLLSAFFISKLLMGYKLSKRLFFHPITILILLDLAWLFISSCFSQMPEVSFKRLIIRSCYYCSFYYFYSELFGLDLKNIKRVFSLHALGFIVPITYALVKHSQYQFSTMGSPLVAAPFYFDHTIYGACLVFFIPFLLTQFICSVHQKEKWLYAILSLIFIVAAVLSYSRAAWLSVLIATGLFWIIKYKIKITYLFFCLSIVLVALLFNWKSISAVLEKNKEQSHSNDIGTHIKSISNINTDVSNKERINRWKCALRMFADKPVFGFGPGTYQFYYGKYQQRSDLTRISTFSGNKGHAHSEYLNYLSETGLIGLLIFLSLGSIVIFKCIRLIQNGVDASTKNIAAFLFMGLMTFFIHGFFNGFLEFDKVAMPVFSSFAAITVLDLKQSEHFNNLRYKPLTRADS